MDAITSPTKRRALTSLNANALPSPRFGKQHDANPKPVLSPFKDADRSSAGRKRAFEVAATPTAASPTKRTRVEGAEQDDARSRSHSPCSSIFDVSGNDSSWANTTATEPDTSPVPRAMTREQAREKAEILRLRLGLASYKFRTGQTTVALADLQRKPILPTATRQKKEGGSSVQQRGGNTVHEKKEQDSRVGEDGSADEAEEPRSAEVEDAPVAETLLPSSKALVTPPAKPVLEEDRWPVVGGALGGAAAAAAALLRPTLAHPSP